MTLLLGRWMSLEEGAELLGVSQPAVRRYVEAGELLAEKRAGAWFTPETEVRRLRALPRTRGRPRDPGAAWAYITNLPSAPAVTDLAAFYRSVRRRAARRPLTVHASLLPRLQQDRRVCISGHGAVHRIPATNRDVVGWDANDLTDAYVRAADAESLCRDVGAAPPSTSYNLVLWVVPPGHDLPEEASASLVLVDLFESPVPRWRGLAADALTRGPSQLRDVG